MTPVPFHSEAAQVPSWTFMAVSVLFFVACAAWIARQGRSGALLPGLAFLGGAIAALEESWIDSMIRLWYPRNAPMVLFTAVDHPQPLYVFLVYPGFVGLGSYIAYRGLVRHPEGRWLWRTFWGIVALDILFEVPATATHVFSYYGAQPFQLIHDGWPAWVAPINAAGPVLGGTLIYVFAPRFVGRARLLIALLPPLAYAAVFASAGWPTYTMLDSSVPAVARWAAAVVTMCLCFAIVWLIRISLRASGSEVGDDSVPQPDHGLLPDPAAFSDVDRHAVVAANGSPGIGRSYAGPMDMARRE